ncbi:concanavalin A-like lectin/glucanase domain-containing protein [Mycotypha africana]|uniref:concanavalin A-like lectin/glucanase domain-containing protein n=1 Tax=Mycotypha africana TaxID=64632 RepID=UPI0023010067|nr:concanavalin A-like lectin/glucanase domain-containing protein [Mycotypha africana]KAI8991583.1 concanavalin A-like lectin/glucanase domain-containing protein [Mycotypha africana]
MYLAKLSLCAAVILGASAASTSSGGKNKCQNLKTDFSNGLGEWFDISGKGKGYKVTSEGLELTLEPPKQFVRMTNPDDNDNPYNKYESDTSADIQAPQKLHYGKVTYVMKSAGVKGAITDAILISDEGDEIDFEMLGAERNRVQTNFFYGKNPVYGVNGGNSKVDLDTADDFHTYVIEWSPEKIVWSVDGKVIRTKNNDDDCSDDDKCTFPTHPTNVQFGLWDASNPSDTAEWAGGPIDWDKTDKVSAVVKSVQIECDPEYNELI